MINRYEVTAKEKEKYVCFAGWDKGRDSYFVYVARRMKQERGRLITGADGFSYDGHTVLWRGTKDNDIDSVEEVARILEPYATLPAELYQPLRELRLKSEEDRRVAERRTKSKAG